MKTFDSDKTIKELGIDTTRKFIVVSQGQNFPEWTLLTLDEDDNTSTPWFKDEKWDVNWMNLDSLAYYEEEKEELTLPRWVYVSDESEEQALKNKIKVLLFHILPESKGHRYVTVDDWDTLEDWSCFTRWRYIAEIPKKVPKEKMTLEQIEEALGKKIEIIN